MLHSKGLVLVTATGLFASLLAYESQSSEPPPRWPWDWTMEERLRERYAAGAVERRQQRSPSTPTVEARGVQVIDGRHEPALFLPWELFDSLIARAYALDPETREVFRLQIEQNLDEPGGIHLPEGVWQRIEAAAEELIQSRRQQLTLATRLRAASSAESAALLEQIEERQESGCQERLSAMRAVEEELGEDLLLRLLYQGVAPNTFVQESVTEDRRAELVFVQDGCR